MVQNCPKLYNWSETVWNGLKTEQKQLSLKQDVVKCVKQLTYPEGKRMAVLNATLPATNNNNKGEQRLVGRKAKRSSYNVSIWETVGNFKFGFLTELLCIDNDKFLCFQGRHTGWLSRGKGPGKRTPNEQLSFPQPLCLEMSLDSSFLPKCKFENVFHLVHRPSVENIEFPLVGLQVGRPLWRYYFINITSYNNKIRNFKRSVVQSWPRRICELQVWTFHTEGIGARRFASSWNPVELIEKALRSLSSFHSSASIFHPPSFR